MKSPGIDAIVSLSTVRTRSVRTMGEVKSERQTNSPTLTSRLFDLNFCDYLLLSRSVSPFASVETTIIPFCQHGLEVANESIDVVSFAGRSTEYEQAIVEMRGDSPHEVGKLINYFESYINDLNKDFPLNSKGKSSSSDLTHVQQPFRTTSQNTSHLSVSVNEVFPSILPTIPDEDFNQTMSEDIYDRLTYQTLVGTESPSIPNLSSQELLPPASIRSTKRRHCHTGRKRLHRRHAPTYIKELKAYLAHRQSAVTEIVKISDVKKFSNVLVWLSNQTTSPSLIETSLVQTESSSPKEFNQHSLSITTDSVLGITQDNSQLDSGTDRSEEGMLSSPYCSRSDSSVHGRRQYE